MKELWVKLKEWWANLALREKQAVSIGGSLFFLFIFYQGIWSPYLNHVAAMRNKITSDQKVLLWMQSADKIMQNIEIKSDNKTKTVSPVVFLSQIQKQIDHAGLEQSLTQLKQGTNESIEMHFQKVEFEKLIKFLAQVIKEYHVAISQMTLTAIETPGFVNADIHVNHG